MQICQTIINILIDIYVDNSNRSISLTHLSMTTCGLRVCELGYVGVKQDKLMGQNGTLPQCLLLLQPLQIYALSPPQLTTMPPPQSLPLPLDQKSKTNQHLAFPKANILFLKTSITKRVSQQRGKTAVLTSYHYKKSLLEKNGEETYRKASVKLSANPESTFLHPKVSARKWIHSACIVLSCRPTLKVQKAGQPVKVTVKGGHITAVQVQIKETKPQFSFVHSATTDI